MHPFSFLTINSTSEGLFKEKGSKFISFAIPVESEEEVKEKLTELRKKFYDARHHCFAYMLGADCKRFRAFDDGEPNHSAGDPILGQIKARGLTNVLVVVVRYFGGVKLGVGSLVQAYKMAANDALVKTEVVEKDVTKKFELLFDYESNADVMRLVKEFELEILHQTYSGSCLLVVSVKLRNQIAFLTKIKFLNDLRISIRLTEHS